MATRILITIRPGALLSASRPPARLSTLKAKLTTVATKTYDQDIKSTVYEIRVDGEPWIVVDNSFVVEHPTA